MASFMLFAMNSFGQGSTTSAMNGKIVSGGEALSGATVVAVHTPTGSQYGTITDEQGFFRIPNMNVGGPYKLTVSFVGYQSYVKDGIYLTLGQTYRVNADIKKSDVQLEDVVVTAYANDVFDGNKTGAETVVDERQINALPTVSRSMSDFVRLTPQASVDDAGGISIGGMNNRYNSISIDGAVNNDVFGLTSTGTNGGQTGGTPISLDAIKQFQVVLAPFDVRQGGFAGGGVNAVTRSGTNKFDGSAYYFMRNQNLAGLTPTDDETVERKKLAEYSAATYGARIGGPIIKDKLFFFVNAEIQRDETPQPFNFSDYEGDATQADLTALENKLSNEYGYDAGGYLNNAKKLNGEKFLARIDYNINQNHKLSLRHSYTNNESLSPSRSSNRSISYYNNGVYFPSVTNSSALELKSNWNTMSNDLIIGYTTVRDDRDPLGNNFPSLRIYDGSGTIYLGSEPYSTANQLDQNVLTITDNFSIYKGKHTITFGTHNEFTSVYNLFMRKNFGEYRYSSLADFMDNANTPAYQYERGYSLVDNVTGDGSAAAADFNMMQFGVYAQDEFQISDNFKFTYGVRIDLPVFPTNPKEDTYFNTTTIPLIEAEGYDLKGAKAGQMPKTQVMFAPRIGFNWDIKGDETSQLRGGFGIFTSRVPLVWPAGSYTNNGLTIGGVYHRSSWGTDIDFRPDWDNQYTNIDFGGTDVIPSGQMDLFAENFKLPQVLRASLAYDQKLPMGMIGTLEAMYTKTLNNVIYYNLNATKATGNITMGQDTRPYYGGGKVDGTYTRIMLGDNTSEGYAYDLTAQIQKPFDNGLTFSLAYTFGRSMALNDGTSSQNSSQWRYMEQVNGLNNLDLSYSDFDRGGRVMAYASYKIEYLNHAATTISLFYNGQAGSRYSYVYADRGNLNGSGESDNNLIWVPASASEVNLVDIGVTGDADYVSAAAQWTALEAYIDGDDYLSTRKGDYAERNGARGSFSNIFDLKLVQDIFVNAADRKQTLQFTFDIFNLGNMLNKDWGRRYYVSYDYVRLINFEGFEADGTTPQFTFETPKNIENIDDSGISSSRWQAQFGIRYIF